MFPLQVEIVINGKPIPTCLVNGGATVNVLASWLFDHLELEVKHQLHMRPKDIDQHCIKTLG